MSKPNAVEVIKTDVIIIGAGPVGLFAVFELGLWDMRAAVIDVLSVPGGQCAELYPEKPIYDIPACPVITGAQLTERLLEQIAPFKPQMLLNQSAESLESLPDGHFRVTTDTGTLVEAPCVFVAAGGGRFTPKKLTLPGAEAFEGGGLIYAIKKTAELLGKRVIVAGGGDSALDWALTLLPIAASVTLLHRRDDFRAAPHSLQAMREAVEAGRMQLCIGELQELQGLELQDKAPQLQAVTIKQGTQTLTMPADVLAVFYGLTMKPGPVAGFGLETEGGLIKVDTERFASSRPGIFAIGDINTYPGKLKLILSGFHEAALAARAAHDIVHAGKRFLFRYTTASSDLHRKLGVL